MTDSTEEPENNSEDEGSEHPASISCTLGGLELTVEGTDLDEAEDVFERVWERRLEEAGNFSDALRERLVGHQ